MAVNVALTAASSDFFNYLSSFDANFAYNGNGWFNGIAGGEDQWAAGNYTTPPTSPNGQPSAVMDIDNYSYAPGAFNGDVTKLALGTNLVHNFMNDIFVQTDQLIITPDGTSYLPVTSTFNEAIYALSHGGAVNGGSFTFNTPGGPVTQQFDGLTDYFAEQGTNQTGTAGDDTLLSFAGDDSLTGSGAALDFDTFRWDADYYDTDSGTAAGWGDDVVADFVSGNDLLTLTGFGWEDEIDFQNDGGSLLDNVITYFDSASGITSTIEVNFSGGGTLTWGDIIFEA